MSFRTGFAAIALSMFSVPALPAAALPEGCVVAARQGAVGAAIAPAFPPTPLQVRTPVEPRIFPSGGRNYLLYELHLQNFSTEAMTVRAIQVMHADATHDTTLAVLNEAEVNALMRPIGVDDVQHHTVRKGDAQRRMAGGQGAAAFLCLAFDGAAPIPAQLRHRIVLDGAVAEGPLVHTRAGALPVLGRPVEGSDWIAASGPSVLSHHRMGLIVAGGLAQLSRRFAFDFRQVKGGASFAGDARDVRAHHVYAQRVFAVADGTVVLARDGLPDNIPRTAVGFTPALPITLDNLAGNSVVIALADGQFASYAHLQPGSVQVKPGERVKRGQWLGRVGNSGDAREPHLHFQLTSGPDILASEGAPFVFEQYRMRAPDGVWETRSGEYPMGPMTIDFGP